MTQPAKPQAPPQPALPADPFPPYRRLYAWLFQAWLIMFLAVICGALFFYLLSYIPRGN